MGLDIAAYSGVELVLDAANRHHIRRVRHHKVFVNPAFPAQADDLVDGGIYSFKESMSFRAGSYGSYGSWRACLADVGGYDPTEAWRGVFKEHRLPFFDLVHFSDCEGVIGSTTCATLYDDFEVFAEKVREQTPFGTGWQHELYFDFMDAFRFAMRDGFVEFC